MTEYTQKEKNTVGASLSLLCGPLCLIAVIVFLIIGNKQETTLFSSENESSTTTEKDKSIYTYCNVYPVTLHGTVVTYLPRGFYEDQTLSSFHKDYTSSEEVVYAIDQANKRDDVEIIFLEVDSSGGSPVAGEEIAYAIAHSKKKVVVAVRQIAASAAYWAISPASYIFASQNSDVGGIGVTASYTQHIDKDKEFIDITSTKYKDYGNPDKKISKEEKAILQRDVNEIHKHFIEAIAQARKLSTTTVDAFADGTTVLGKKALERKMIDAIGVSSDALSYIHEQINKEVSVCGANK